jgi:hypothetical protein
MAKVGRLGQRIFKIIHQLFAALWIGGSVTLYLMTLCLDTAKSGWELYGYSVATKFVDDVIIVPGAMGTLITGILLCCFTHWGFFKHAFVIVKFVLTIICIVVGIVVLGPTVNGQPPLIAEFGLFALDEDAYKANRFFCLLGGGLQIVAIHFMAIISTLKPWNRKKAEVAKT